MGVSIALADRVRLVQIIVQQPDAGHAARRHVDIRHPRDRPSARTCANAASTESFLSAAAASASGRPASSARRRSVANSGANTGP